MTRRVEVVPYQPEWVALFRQEAKPIAFALSPQALAALHIGNASIPGQPAWPTLDFLVEVIDIAAVDALTPAMQRLGYIPKGENSIPVRRYFQKLDGEMHTWPAAPGRCLGIHQCENGIYPEDRSASSSLEAPSIF